jgi:tRNA threonylcarbamoyladenosine biosynthesis protein TsaB
MSLILNIDTSGGTAFVSLSQNGETVHALNNEVSKDHAAFLHKAINKLFKLTGKIINQLDAVAVTEGPGSYTGIRVGMASAKGLCVALKIPLITINTLELLAKDIQLHQETNENSILVPMIDARRMEVYTAVYDLALKELKKPYALILNEKAYTDLPEEKQLLFFGNGAEKFHSVVKLRNFSFTVNVNIIKTMSFLSQNKYSSKAFTGLIYSEPFYLKEFFDQR